MLTEGDAVLKSPLAADNKRFRTRGKRRGKKGKGTRPIIPMLRAAGYTRTKPERGGYFA